MEINGDTGITQNQTKRILIKKSSTMIIKGILWQPGVQYTYHKIHWNLEQKKTRLENKNQGMLKLQQLLRCDINQNL